ncbi:hypothetical protein [Amycolatopsis alkalitolerans]|uniref:Hemophore-related protein n=1 Tax=Amycolatopsis alkalitolerans TaxID=2547244 RepID=A0A5C4LUB1_9PSEU|nr:hypothetical protein [Amycolatopsis alkalitolerans]TNC20992.1 hypothetical protein FG385_29530 [Amycolatopsis alkalitolerans]
MLSHPVRTAVVGTVIAAGMLGGTAGVAQAAPAQPAAPQPVLCSTVDALQAALQNLSQATDPMVIDAELGQVIALLQGYPPVLPTTLMPTYDWLIAKFQVLRTMVATLPAPQLIVLVNDLTAQLAAALGDIPCAPQS